MKETINERIVEFNELELDIISFKGKIDYTGIVIHHSEYRGNEDQVFDIDKWHIKREWLGIGYHFVVEKSGKIFATFRYTEGKTAAHTLTPDNMPENYYNENYIGICVAGDGREEEMTHKQHYSLVKLVGYLARHYSIGQGELHTHAVLQGNKHCPGRKIEKEFYILNIVMFEEYEKKKENE